MHKIYPATKDRFPKLKKNDQPSPCTYKVAENIQKTRWADNSFKFDKDKVTNFFTEGAKRKKYVPGAGHYKETEKAFNKLSKPPTSLRRYR